MKLKLVFKSVLFCLLVLLISGCTSLSVKKESITDPLHEYFIEIALGNEFGINWSRIKKWNQDINIQIKGEPTLDDLKALKNVVNTLGYLTKLSIRFTEDNRANFKIYFVPKFEFGEIEPHYELGNTGFFWLWWNPFTSKIYQADVLISTTELTQEERNHLIFEEVTQSLGLMNDSNRYADSIFYQKWSRVTRLSEIDRGVIRLLYHQGIVSGMDRQEVLEVLKGF